MNILLENVNLCKDEKNLHKRYITETIYMFVGLILNKLESRVVPPFFALG